MFFRLFPISGHPCFKMQGVVEAFFEKSANNAIYSSNLFPKWFRDTILNPACALSAKFEAVHKLLYLPGMTLQKRRAIYAQLLVINHIESLCEGKTKLPIDIIQWDSPLGKAISALMLALYGALDLAVFRREGDDAAPTYVLYGEFIEKNKYVCPFCGLDKFKNRKGARREDFDHYLHKSDYPLAAANMKNLVPTCGTCNQDYKKAQDILKDGLAFYPYSAVPKVRVEIDCDSYPNPGNFSDSGRWDVKIELVKTDKKTVPKMLAWDRVYHIKSRLENEIREFFEDWMTEVSDGHAAPVDQHQFLSLLELAKTKANRSAKRRMEPRQIIKEAFYDFILTRAKESFVESFRSLKNAEAA